MYVLYGAGGMIGSRILAEALRRGHCVKIVARNPAKFQAAENVEIVEGDVIDGKGMALIIKGADAVLSAVGGEPQTIRDSIPALLDGSIRAGSRRLVIVGGSGSLEVRPGVQMVDTPTFPAAYKKAALAHRDALNELRKNTTIAWTYLSPPAEIAPGKRTGKFRLGKDQLLLDATGKSAISAEDYAVAFMDETEQAKHIRQRFTVAY